MAVLSSASECSSADEKAQSSLSSPEVAADAFLGLRFSPSLLPASSSGMLAICLLGEGSDVGSFGAILSPDYVTH